ncbi:MAG: diacylglycerol/lipid kinase family protein [Intrasporangium sp.]|uniref:diacylglycerol/lipid kinase family protein n=1 Tax=Intrasporangium sp. TaxID=1925024 RepID=UPI003F7E8ED5
MRLAVVANPVRDPARAAVAALEAGCRSRGWPEPVVAWTTVAAPGGTQARAAAEDGADLVVVVGGDGTVREVAGALAGTGVPLGIVPRGTANLFARNLRLPYASLRRSVAVALDGVPRDVDLGRARWGRPDGAVREGPFVVMAGVGQDARTIELVRPALKKHIRWVAYFVPALATLGAPLLPMRFRRDDGPMEEGRLWCLLAGSVGRIPLGVEVLRGARANDGLLHVLAVGPGHLVGWVPIALKGLLRWHWDVPGLQQSTARSVRVESDLPLTIHVDGDEHAGVVWLEARIEPSAVRIKLPSHVRG